MVFTKKTGSKGFRGRHSVRKKIFSSKEFDESEVTRTMHEIEESLVKFDTAVEGLKGQVAQIEVWKKELMEKLDYCKQLLTKIGENTSVCSSPIKEELLSDDAMDSSSSSRQSQMSTSIIIQKPTILLSASLTPKKQQQFNSSWRRQSGSPSKNSKSNGLINPFFNGLRSHGKKIIHSSSSNKFSKDKLLASLEKIKIFQAKTIRGTETRFRCTYCSHDFGQKGNAQRHVCKAHFTFMLRCQQCESVFYDEVLLVKPICAECSMTVKKETSCSSRNQSFSKTITSTSRGSTSGNANGKTLGGADTVGSGSVIAIDINEVEKTNTILTTTTTAMPTSNRASVENSRNPDKASSAIYPAVLLTPVPKTTDSNSNNTANSDDQSSIVVSEVSTSEIVPEKIKTNTSKSDEIENSENSPSIDIVQLMPLSLASSQSAPNGVQNTCASREIANIVIRNADPNFDLKRTLSVSVALKRVSLGPNYVDSGIEVENLPSNAVQNKSKRTIKKRRLSDFFTDDDVETDYLGDTSYQYDSNIKTFSKKKSVPSIKSTAKTLGKTASKGLPGKRGVTSRHPLAHPSTSVALNGKGLRLPRSPSTKSKIGPRKIVHSPDITTFGTKSVALHTPLDSKKKLGRPRKILVSKLTLTEVQNSQEVSAHGSSLVSVSDVENTLISNSTVPVTISQTIVMGSSNINNCNTVKPLEIGGGVEMVSDMPVVQVGEFGCPRCNQRFESNAEAKMHQLVNHDGSSTETIQLGFADVQENYRPLDPVTESSVSALVHMDIPTSEPLPLVTATTSVSSERDRELALQAHYSIPTTVTSPRNILVPSNLNVLTEADSPCIPPMLPSNNTDGGISLHRNYEQLVTPNSDGNPRRTISDHGVLDTIANSSFSISANTSSTVSAIDGSSELASPTKMYSCLGGSGTGEDEELGVVVQASFGNEFTGAMTTLSNSASLVNTMSSFVESRSPLHYESNVGVSSAATVNSLMELNSYQEVVPMTSGAVAVPVPIDASTEYSYGDYMTYSMGVREEPRMIPDFEEDEREQIEQKLFVRDPNFVVWEGFHPDTNLTQPPNQGTLRLGRDGIEMLPSHYQSLENS